MGVVSVNDYRGYRYNPVNNEKVVIKKKRNWFKSALACCGILTLFGSVASIIGSIGRSKGDTNPTNTPDITYDQVIPTYNPTTNEYNDNQYQENSYVEPTPVVTEEPVVYYVEESTPVPTAEPIKMPANQGDSVVAVKDVNMRLNTSTSSFKLGNLPKGAVVDRILSIDGFDLVRYYDQIAFVSNEFTSSDVADYNQEYYYVEEYNDVVRTTDTLHFRLGPSKRETKLFTLEKDEELVVFGKATTYDTGEEWYLVRARGQIGFVSAKYTRSLKDIVKSMDPNIDEVIIKSFGYASQDANITDQYGNSKAYVEKYQLLEIFAETSDSYLVNYNGNVGYISKNCAKKMPGSFVAVDISSQRVYLYIDNDMAFKGKCTTGANKTPTNLGYFEVYERTNSRYFSENAQARKMWANFDHGNGFHDAPWEPEEKFGSEKYRKNNGSKGCVRLPDSVADVFSKYIKMGTKVLVKK